MDRRFLFERGLLNQTGFFEGDVRAAFVHGLQTFCRNIDGDAFVELWDEKSLFLDVYLAAAFADRVVFGRTDAVRIAASDLRFLACYCAFPCHDRGTIREIPGKIKLRERPCATLARMLDQLFVVVIIIFSAVIHEVMHGVAADYLGDKTARYAGRLTLNPIPHLDPLGSVLLPILFAFSGSPIFFGWAKPVPYNPYNLRPGRFSEAIVAGAGPASNLVIALLFGAIIRLHLLPVEISSVVFLIVLVNIMLFLFNLIPVPPLDGSKVIEALLPYSLQYRYSAWRRQMEANPFLGMGIVVLVIILLGGAFGSAVYAVAQLIAGA